MMNSRGHQVSDLLTALENTVQSASLADLPCLLGRLEQVKAVVGGGCLQDRTTAPRRLSF